MKSTPAPARRRYDASGRLAAARETHDAIVAAAIARLRRVRPEELTYADVASDAGIAMRTVYRHFPTPQDLFAAALDRFLGETLGTTTLDGKNRTELVDVMERIHARLSAEPGLYRLFFTLPLRSGVGMTALVKAVCADALARIPKAHHDAVCAAIELMLGPYAWETFHTHWSVPPARMTQAVLASVQAMLDRFVAQPELLDPTVGRPPMFLEAPQSKHPKPKPKKPKKEEKR